MASLPCPNLGKHSPTSFFVSLVCTSICPHSLKPCHSHERTNEQYWRGPPSHRLASVGLYSVALNINMCVHIRAAHLSERANVWVTFPRTFPFVAWLNYLCEQCNQTAAWLFAFFLAGSGYRTVHSYGWCRSWRGSWLKNCNRICLARCCRRWTERSRGRVSKYPTETKILFFPSRLPSSTAINSAMWKPAVAKGQGCAKE